MWTGFIWLKLGTRSGLLWTWFGFHKMLGISWLAHELSNLQGLCSLELVTSVLIKSFIHQRKCHADSSVYFFRVNLTIKKQPVAGSYEQAMWHAPDPVANCLDCTLESYVGEVAAPARGATVKTAILRCLPLLPCWPPLALPALLPRTSSQQ
jgi:hypothetical protein